MSEHIVHEIEGFDKVTEWLVEEVDVTHLSPEALCALSGAPDMESDGGWPLDADAIARFESALGIKFDKTKNDYFLSSYDLAHPASGSTVD